MNPGITENIKEGQEIWVPSTSDSKAKNNPDMVLYSVEKAEGFYSLERKFGLTEAELIKINPELRNGIKSDSQIWIPKENFEQYRNATLLLPDANYQFENSNATLMALTSRNNVKQISLVLPFKVSNIDETDRFLKLKDQLASDKVTPITADFYSGVLIALDSLQKMGFAFKVNVYDSEANDQGIQKIIHSESLQNSQLIIGPFLPKPFNALASQITSPEVAILAPLSNKNIDLSPNVYQTLPTEEVQESKIIDYISTKYPSANILLFTDSKNNSIREKLERNFVNAKVVTNVSANSVANALDYSRQNIAFIQSDDVAYVSNVAQSLHSCLTSKRNGMNPKIILTTTNRGNVYDSNNISNSQLSDLQFTFPSFNRYTNGDNNFSKVYFQKYGITPNKYAIRGFDITMDAVLRLGVTSNFMQSNGQIGETSYVENKFAYLKNPNKGGGFENQGVYILNYNNLEIKEIKKENDDNQSAIKTP